MIAYFARQPTAANLLMVGLIILGLVTLPKLQRDTFPIVSPTEVEVRIAYPGATPGEVEDSICQRSEEVLDTISHLQEVRCDAREPRHHHRADGRRGRHDGIPQRRQGPD